MGRIHHKTTLGYKHTCFVLLIDDQGYLFSGSCCKHSCTRLKKAGEKVFVAGVWSRSLLTVWVPVETSTLSPIPESTPDWEFLILESDCGKPPMSSGLYGGPFSFCNSIWEEGKHSWMLSRGKKHLDKNDSQSLESTANVFDGSHLDPRKLSKPSLGSFITWVLCMSWKGTRPVANSHAVIPTL